MDDAMECTMGACSRVRSIGYMAAHEIDQGGQQGRKQMEKILCYNVILGMCIWQRCQCASKTC